MEEVNLLEIAPVRLAEWEEIEGRVVVHRPLSPARGPRRLWERFVYELAAKRIRLDEMGSHVWLLLDGEHTVGQVADRLRERFGDEIEQAEERLGQLLHVLHREKFIEYPGFERQ